MSECDKCPGYCCIGDESHPYTPLTDDDICGIAKYLQIPLGWFDKEYVAHTRFQYDTAPNAHAHVKFGPGPCLFLRQGVCAVYPVRPEVCRATSPRKPIGVNGEISCMAWHKMRVLKHG